MSWPRAWFRRDGRVQVSYSVRKYDVEREVLVVTEAVLNQLGRRDLVVVEVPLSDLVRLNGEAHVFIGRKLIDKIECVVSEYTSSLRQRRLKEIGKDKKKK